MPNADSTAAGDPEGLVLTPGGMWEEPKVHLVKPGVAVDFDEERDAIQLVELGNGRILLELPAEPQPALPPSDEFWGVRASWTNSTGTPLGRFSTVWQVPPGPSAVESAATIFLGNGIQPDEPEYDSGQPFIPPPVLLQPTLQWGESAAGGGRYWSIASWYLTSAGHAFHTEPQPVKEGATLIGLTEMFVQARDIFSYQCEFQGEPATRLPVLNIPELHRCHGSFNAYGAKERSELPATEMTCFTEIEVQTGHVTPSVTWVGENSGSKVTGVQALPKGSAEVDISYVPPKL